MTAARRLRTGFVAGAALYTLGQGCTLLLQWLLLRQFGLHGYGEVGLAHLALPTVLFLADLGYGSLFLRENPAAADWATRWRQALGHRLCATVLLDLLLLAAAWWRTAGHGDGFAYLVAALPATVFGLVGYSAPLLAQGRRMLGFLVQQIAMPVAIVAWLALRATSGSGNGGVAGLAVSIGYLVQALVNVAAFGGPLRLLAPRRGGGRRPLGVALHLSLLGIAGLLHDRLTPVLLASIAPAVLPGYLILGYALSGASGVFNQFNRLLLAEAATELGERWARGLASLVLGLSALGAHALLLVAAGWDGAARAWLPWAMPVLAAGAVSLLSGVLSALLIGRHRERALLWLLLCGLSCSALLQLAAAAQSAPQVLLWARLLCLLAIAAASLRLCGMRLNPGGHAAMASALLASAPWLGTGAWMASAALLPAAAWFAWRQRGLLRERTAAHAR